MQQVSQVFVNLCTQQQVTREGGSLGSRLTFSLIATFFKKFLNLHASTTVTDSETYIPISGIISFAVAESLGAAGGVLVLLTALIRKEVMVVMWMIKRKNSTTNTHNCYRRAWSVCSISTIVFLVVLIDLVNIAWLGFKVYLFFLEAARTSSLYFSNFFHYMLELTTLNMSLVHSICFSLLVLYFNWNYGERNRDNREELEQAAATEDSELTTSLIDRDNPSSDYRLYNTNGSEYSVSQNGTETELLETRV